MFRMLPHTRRIVMAASARLGVAADDETFGQHSAEPLPLGPDGKPQLVIPASERFFAGGDTTVRGFALDQLGIPLVTLDEKGFPTGGGGLMILNAELRVPTTRGLGIVGFFDTGNVFYRTSDIRLGDLRGSLGFGVRYKSPIGPIRVDLGFKLQRNVIAGKREPLTALHITLGQAF
jgi:outer membrane translocation and assembly module TamA